MHLADGYGGKGGGNGGGGGGGGGGGVLACECKLELEDLCGARCNTRLPILGDRFKVGLDRLNRLGDSCERLLLLLLRKHANKPKTQGEVRYYLIYRVGELENGHQVAVVGERSCI